MASKQNVQSQAKAGNKPVKSGIHRAAKRIGYEAKAPVEETAAPADELDRTDEERDVLRAIAAAALLVFEHDGHPRPTSEEVLKETLLSARSDIELLEHAENTGLAYCRAQYRIDLGIALADYVRTFGIPESDEERAQWEAVGESYERMQARMAGGAS